MATALERKFKRISYKLKRIFRNGQSEEAPKRVATLADVENKLRNYEKTQGPANFTGPQVRHNLKEQDRA